MKKDLLLLPLTLVLLAACAGWPLAGRPQPTAAPSPRPPALHVLFQDDFSDPASGWDTVQEKDAVIAYTEGRFRIWLNYPHTMIWANPHLHFTDTRTEVDAIKMTGPDDNAFGLLCRYRDENHFYFFLISSDGYYGIGKADDQGQTLLTGNGNMDFSKAIHQGHTPNHLRADCVGPTLTLYVNGQRLAQVEDTDFTEGDVGLMVNTFAQPGADIAFDNFAVFQP